MENAIGIIALINKTINKVNTSYRGRVTENSYSFRHRGLEKYIGKGTCAGWELIELHRVFVYGTLLKGERNHHFLKNAKCIAEHCWTHAELFDTGNGYPAIKLSNEHRVYGELYEITERELIELDGLEGYTEGGKGNLYDRVKGEVVTKNDKNLAYIYIAAREQLLQTPIPSGDWRTK